MSSIDKYWSDRLIYHIGFIANVSKTNSLVEKKSFIGHLFFHQV